ncbi:MAG: hypothetical protein ABMB14_08635 [Myxococcota bacterium]
MDLDRMLAKCRRDQWSVGDLDWSRPPPTDWPAEKEQAVVQYFTDMAAIERLAGALFEEQRRSAPDPRLEQIFASFVVDELRHAHVAQQLADHYDVHHHRYYQVNDALRAFAPHFVYAVRFLSAEFATIYITTGELILDIALLRSLDDYCADPMSAEAMARINQDESRHIAIDFHMIERYATAEWQATLAAAPPRPIGEQVRAWWAFGQVLRHARPFFREVFFRPMELTDPSGRRVREAFKRMQLLSAKPAVAARPFSRFVLSLQRIHNHPVLGRVFGRAMVRLLGIDPDVIRHLYDADEFRWAAGASFDELASAALAQKLA